MLSDGRLLDLVVFGGLTIDRFADGSTAPGGSVIHSTRAAVAEGASVGIVTVSGDEPEARAALESLAAIGVVVRQPASATVAYGHREADGHRVLWLERPAEPLTAETMRRAPQTSVAVFAPIAGELPASAIAALRHGAPPQRSVALIQGWLRTLRLGRPVEPLPPAALDADLRAELARMDAVIASTEDLVAVGDEPLAQLRALREVAGPGPVVVLTLGTDGYLLDDPAHDRIAASYPRRVVHGVPTVGAGDTYGAVMALHLGRGAAPGAAAAAAAESVIRILERRGGAPSASEPIPPTT